MNYEESQKDGVSGVETAKARVTPLGILDDDRASIDEQSKN